MVRETSVEVYNRITNQGLLPKKRIQVYKIIYQGGALTGSQIAQRYKQQYPTAQHSESIRNRITELVQQGVVDEVGTVECPITKNRVLQFKTNNSLPVKLTQKITKKQKISKALKEITELGLKMNEEGNHQAWKNDLLNIYRLVGGI